MDMKAYMAARTALVNRELDRRLPSEKREPKTLHRTMRYSVFSGGKRIRPILAIESAKICGGKLKAVLPIACAIELIHTYSLVHDDLPAMDDDDFRRGKPSCHRAFGEASAILAGDALLTLAFEMIALHGKNSPQVIAELARAAGSCGMVAGQMMDIECTGRRKDISEINRLKTAKLFEASAQLGAIACGASKRERAALSKFGEALGMAFQAADDISDKETCAVSASECGRLIEKAKGYLRIFGKRADRLKEIADYIICHD